VRRSATSEKPSQPIIVRDFTVLVKVLLGARRRGKKRHSFLHTNVTIAESLAIG